MCGRFTLRTPPDDIARAVGLSVTPNLPARYNIAPTQEIACVRAEDGERRLVQLRWGLVPFWAKDLSIGAKMINARAETVAEKPAFRAAFAERRCLVLADGFYEWKTDEEGRKQPWHVSLTGDRPFGFAGLWERWDKEGEPVETCTIVTTEAAPAIAGIHPRMPVILPDSDHEAWLTTPKDEAEGLTRLLRPWPGDDLVARPVSRRVNKVANDDASLLEADAGENEAGQRSLL